MTSLYRILLHRYDDPLPPPLSPSLQYKHGVQVVHVSLHPNFQRDDLFRLLHINGLLVSASGDQKEEEGKREDLNEERKTSTVQQR